jgi:hypothetical protein
MWKQATHENETYDVMHQNQVSNCLKIHIKLEKMKRSIYQMKKVWAPKFCVTTWIHSMFSVSTDSWIQHAIVFHKNYKFHVIFSSFSWRKTHQTWKMQDIFFLLRLGGRLTNLSRIFILFIL